MNTHPLSHSNRASAVVLEAPITAAASTPQPSFVDVVLRRKLAIGLFAIGGGLIAFALTLPQVRLYRAHTSLEFTEVNENVMNARDIDPTATTDTSSQAFINTDARVLESTPLLERVVKKVKATMPGGSSQRQNTLNNLTPRSLHRNLTIRPGDGMRLVDIYVDSPDAQLSADLANTLTSEYSALNLESRWDATKRTSGWLNQELDEARGRLEKSEAALQEYARKTNLVFTGSDGSVSEARLREVQDDYSKAQADRVEKQATYESLLAQKPDDITASLKDPALQEYQLKLSELNRQLADLSVTYQPSYSKIQRIQSQINELKADYKRQHDSVITRLKNDYQTARRREDMLDRTYRAQQATVTREASTTIEYNILKREAETNRAIYEGMLQKVKSYGIASALRPGNARVVDPADVPLFPYKPNVPLTSMFGLMGGLFLGLVWAAIRDKGEINVECPGQTDTVLEANELGVVPSARLDPYLGSVRARRALSSGSPTAGEPRLRPTFETATWFCKSSLVAESIRSVRTSLLSRRGPTGQPNVVVVTSLAPGHGKTSVVSNLGIACAELGRRVLIVDADVRSPGLHSIFGLSNDLGLTAALDGRNSAEQADASRFVQRTDVPCLSLLSSGPFEKGTASSSLLHSQAMVHVLQKLRHSYDTILIDTPPLTLSDARILGPLADGVVLVLRAGDVRLDSVLAAEDRLRQDGSRVIGTVLNDWNPRSNGYGVYPDRYHQSAYFQTASTAAR